jgi:hypothetical protein
MRRPNWVARLRETVAAQESAEFSYGKHDCALFAGRCVDAITGSEMTKAFGYSDRRGAVLALRREGGLEAAVTNRLGEPVAGHNARRGDVCMIDVKTLGVCLGPTIAVLDDRGFLFYPLARAQKHWRVG